MMTEVGPIESTASTDQGRPLHIVHGILSLDVGGLERLVVSLVGAGRQQGHRVSVVCIERPGQLAAEAEASSATLISLDKPPGRLPEFIDRAATILATLQPDVVHTHQIGAAWYLGPAARQLGRPVIHTEHGNHFKQASSWWQALKTRLFVRSTARSIERFCCVSDEIAAAVTRWRTVPRFKVEVVPNGISTTIRPALPSPESVRSVLGIPASAPVIGTVGRLAEVKQQDHLIRAFQNLRQSLPTAHLMLVGDGPERPRLEALSRELALTEWVHFLGYQPLPEQYLRTMNAFALTSRSEGFPVSLLEAWRAGLPAVCSSVGGIPAVVTHEVNGLLYPSGNLAALTTALNRVLTDVAFGIRLGQAGRQVLCERYSLDRMAIEYEARYRDSIAARGGAR